jgi:hypothetical protein
VIDVAGGEVIAHDLFAVGADLLDHINVVGRVGEVIRAQAYGAIRLTVRVNCLAHFALRVACVVSVAARPVRQHQCDK